MLRTAIVGCGKIADAHAAQLRRIAGCEIVAACDREPLMASQLAARFDVPQQFTDVGHMLAKAKPDVVHITTPPATHFPIARQCLQAGCHVYVEKPFTLDTKEAESLLALASARGLKVTAGHDDQFSHVARRMRALVRMGYLGGPAVHMESYYCYDLTDAGYARALLGDKEHWVRRLPGKLLHNIISHGIARIVEFLETDAPHVLAYGYSSANLRRLGETGLVDELRVLIAEEGRTAYFTFSSQMRPGLHQFRVFGPKNALVLDQDEETLIKLSGERLKSYAGKFVPPIRTAWQHVGNVATNARTFLASDFHMKSGMHHLIQSLYRSITDDTPPPISHREILLTARIMESVFEQLDRRSPHADVEFAAPGRLAAR